MVNGVVPAAIAIQRDRGAARARLDDEGARRRRGAGRAGADVRGDPRQRDLDRPRRPIAAQRDASFGRHVAAPGDGHAYEHPSADRAAPAASSRAPRRRLSRWRPPGVLRTSSRAAPAGGVAGLAGAATGAAGLAAVDSARAATGGDDGSAVAGTGASVAARPGAVVASGAARSGAAVSADVVSAEARVAAPAGARRWATTYPPAPPRARPTTKHRRERGGAQAAPIAISRRCSGQGCHLAAPGHRFLLIDDRRPIPRAGASWRGRDDGRLRRHRIRRSTTGAAGSTIGRSSIGEWWQRDERRLVEQIDLGAVRPSTHRARLARSSRRHEARRQTPYTSRSAPKGRARALS